MGPNPKALSERRVAASVSHFGIRAHCGIHLRPFLDFYLSSMELLADNSSAPDVLAGIISKLLTDLVTRNDQVRYALLTVMIFLASTFANYPWRATASTRANSGHAISFLKTACDHREELPRRPVCS